ncbi:DUF397 domain-containing protein [Streptomyces sp. enrichment culture]|uniref:DUF397 domain-containing protein n=1 Tax=Streptomyces sp. enrichment culture TaxID=1795815 RepID=UPI003F5560CD
MTADRLDRPDTGVRNGMSATDLGEQGWERPWSGPNGGQCVEVKRLADGRVALRQSTDPTGPALIYTSEEIAVFLHGVKNGLADHLVTG